MEAEPPGRLQVVSAAATTGAAEWDGVEVDLGNLLAYDPRGPDPTALQADPTAAIIAHGRDVAQRLLNELFALPLCTEQGVVAGRLVELPPPTTRLPREKPLPVPKPPTRWEAYAKEKGIVKRKRSAKVWDEEAGEWLGRHGYRRAGDAEGVPILDAKPGDAEGMEDPFSTARAEKRARVSAQEGRQVANLSAAAKRGGARALPAGVTLSSLVPLSGKGGGAPLGSRLGRDGLKQAASLARQATASMGKFDRPAEGEKPERPAGKRRNFLPVVAAGAGPSAERSAMAAALDGLARREAASTGRLDVERAINTLASDSAGKQGSKGKRGKGRG